MRVTTALNPFQGQELFTGDKSLSYGAFRPMQTYSSVLWGLASACPHLHGGLGGQLRGWQRAHHQVRQGQQASGRCPQREDLLHHRWNG